MNIMPSWTQLRKGVRNPRRAADHLFNTRGHIRSAVVGAASRVPIGTHVLSKDWDILVLLDACRVDAIQSLATEYDFITDINRIWSLGASSPEWMVHTFDKKYSNELSTTSYLTSNAWAKWIIEDQLHPNNQHLNHPGLSRLRKYGDWNLIDPDDLNGLEYIYEYVPEEERVNEQYDEDGELMAGGAPPHYVTDRGIAVGRKEASKRMILHYTQPHRPYLANATSEERPLYPYEVHPFNFLYEGGDREVVWQAYLDELRWVLNQVDVLLNNVDAEKVVISADHGEALGEYDIFNHHTGSLHPKIRYVPWVETSAQNIGDYSPMVEEKKEDDSKVEDRLRALGYKI